ncbi:MAG TPA: NTP transferase domain-containing protein [Polyangia bacterium]|nr:NTP transferase domain-containing protein [Polyangia bacterium]
MRTVAAAIIAGGQARRLGGLSKPLIEIDGRTIADRQLAVLRPLFGRVFAVANDPAPWRALDVEVVPDRVVGAGPFAGLAAALAAAGDAEAVVCVAGDLPFLAPPLMAALRDTPPAARAVAPRPAGRPEPLCARYSAELGVLVEARLQTGRLALHALLEATETTWLDDAALAALDPAGLSFFNVNTPDDLRRAEQIVRQVP